MRCVVQIKFKGNRAIRRVGVNSGDGTGWIGRFICPGRQQVLQAGEFKVAMRVGHIVGEAPAAIAVVAAGEGELHGQCTAQLDEGVVEVVAHFIAHACAALGEDAVGDVDRAAASVVGAALVGYEAPRQVPVIGFGNPLRPPGLVYSHVGDLAGNAGMAVV